MKITKHGDKKLAELKRKKYVKFKCDDCGCEFEADNTEYKYSCYLNEDLYSIKCPCCGNVCYKE